MGTGWWELRISRAEKSSVERSIGPARIRGDDGDDKDDDDDEDDFPRFLETICVHKQTYASFNASCYETANRWNRRLFLRGLRWTI